MSEGSCRVWDLPTRSFHWLLVLHFMLAYLTGDNDRLALYHITAGYVVAALIAFRLLWGITGTHHARFRSFLPRPAALLAYVRGFCHCRPTHFVGHNPLGAVGILLLLVSAIITTATGWAEVLELDLPYLEEIHELIANTMIILVGLHVTGVISSSCMHRENLVAAMIHGCKSTGDDHAAPVRNHGLVAGLLGMMVAAIWLVSFSDRVMPFITRFTTLMLQSQ
jgi:cytochrome b